MDKKLQVAADALLTMTGIINEDTAATVKQQLQSANTQVNLQIGTKLLQPWLAAQQTYNDALVQLADVSKSSATEDAIGGGIGLIGSV